MAFAPAARVEMRDERDVERFSPASRSPRPNGARGSALRRLRHHPGGLSGPDAADWHRRIGGRGLVNIIDVVVSVVFVVFVVVLSVVVNVNVNVSVSVVNVVVEQFGRGDMHDAERLH